MQPRTTTGSHCLTTENVQFRLRILYYWESSLQSPLMTSGSFHCNSSSSSLYPHSQSPSSFFLLTLRNRDWLRVASAFLKVKETNSVMLVMLGKSKTHDSFCLKTSGSLVIPVPSGSLVSVISENPDSTHRGWQRSVKDACHSLCCLYTEEQRDPGLITNPMSRATLSGWRQSSNNSYISFLSFFFLGGLCLLFPRFYLSAINFYGFSCFFIIIILLIYLLF